jgi:alpha-tubulin suppressor-like RCC1 family protein
MSWKNIGTRNRTTSYGIVRTPESSHDVINIGTVLGATGTVIDVKSTLNLEGNDFDKNIGELFVDISNINLHLSRLDGSFALLDKDVSGNDVSNLQNTVTDLSNHVHDLSTNLTNLDNYLDASFVLAVQTLNSSMDTNKGNISSNTGNIATNTSNISSNTGNIATNTSNISTNTSNISTNTGDISSNTRDISSNTSDIATNTSDISSNTSAIATNTSNISSNTSAIATHTTAISTNTSTIATHTTAIATNTGNIATHTTEISNLEGRINGHDTSLNSVQIWNKDSSNNISYSDGNVAIGKDGASNDYALDISGSIQLFDNSYNKLTLSEQTIDFLSYLNKKSEIKAISLGSYFTLILFEDGKVYGGGCNSDGELGLGNNTNYYTSFQQISLLDGLNIHSINSGDRQSFFITNDGKVYGTGFNNKGQLGLGNDISYNTPQLISDISNLTIASLSSGYRHTLFLTDDGKVYSCGLNDDGQLGLGNDISYNTPQFISSISNLTITAVSASADHSLFLTHDGRVYSCGGNSSGQLGLGNNTSFNTPQLITDSSNITAITSGPYYTFLLGSNKRIYGVGLNTGTFDSISGSHRLGLGTSDVSYNTLQQPDISNVDQIVSGPTHSLLIANRDVYVFGKNSGGIGNNSTVTSSTPTKVTQNISGKQFKLVQVSRFDEIDAFSYILSNDNLLYVFGWNEVGQLLNGKSGMDGDYVHLSDPYESSAIQISYPDYQITIPLSTVTMQLTDSSDNVLDISGTIQGRKFQGASNCEANGLGSVAFGTGTRIHSEGGLVVGTYNDNSGALFVVGNGTGSGARGDALTLDSSGNMNLAGDLTAFSTSDIRLKTNVTKIKDPLDKLGKINGYMYDWIENGDTPHKGRDVGVIAQEIEEILPELTITRDNGYKAVKYDKIVALLIECIKEQQTQIDALKQG